MSVHRSEIGKSQFFKEHAAALQNRVFNVIFDIGQSLRDAFAHTGNRADLILDKTLRAQITFGGAQRPQMPGNPADIRRNRHAVVVENHNELGLGGSDIV